MSYNSNLAYFLNRMAGVSTNYFRLEPQNSTTASANKIIRFTLPNNALLNTRSLALHFQATVNGTSAGGRLPKNIDSLIERYEVSCGGVQIAQGFNGYNVLRQAKDALMGDQLNPALGHTEIVRERSYVDGSSITGTNNEIYPSTNNATQFCIDKWDGFLGTVEPAIIDTSLVGDIVVYL